MAIPDQVMVGGPVLRWWRMAMVAMIARVVRVDAFPERDLSMVIAK